MVNISDNPNQNLDFYGLSEKLSNLNPEDRSKRFKQLTSEERQIYTKIINNSFKTDTVETNTVDPTKIQIIFKKGSMCLEWCIRNKYIGA